MASAQLDCPSPSGRPVPQLLPPGPFHSFAFWAGLAVALGVAWRTVRYFLQFPIWGDESFVCINLLDRTYAEMMGPLRAGQLCPITFLWCELALYHLLGPSELVVRLLPFLAGLAALVLFWQLCRLVLPAVPAGLALALLAVSYYPVRHAVEVKPYSVDLLVALGLLVPAVRYLLEPARVRWLVLLALCVPLAVVSSYPAVLVGGALGPALLPIVWKRPDYRVKFWFVVYNLLLVAAFVGNYLLVGKPQLSPHETNPDNVLNTTFQDGFPALDPGSLVLWLLRAHTGNMVAYPIGGPNFASSVSTLLCLAGAWSWWRGGNRQVLALLAWPFVLSMAAALVHKYPYGNSARLDQHLAPAICLLMANGAVFLIQRFAPASLGERKGAALLATCLALFAAGGLIRDIVKPFKTTAELWNRTFVHDLMARMGPDDRVVIFHAPDEVRPGLEWYFHPYRDRIAWHGAIDWERFDVSSGKLWCVQIFLQKPVTDPIAAAVARGGRSPVRVAYLASWAPPEHCAVPELAEVHCFSR